MTHVHGLHVDDNTGQDLRWSIMDDFRTRSFCYTHVITSLICRRFPDALSGHLDEEVHKKKQIGKKHPVSTPIKLETNEDKDQDSTKPHEHHAVHESAA